MFKALRSLLGSSHAEDSASDRATGDTGTDVDNRGVAGDDDDDKVESIADRELANIRMEFEQELSVFRASRQRLNVFLSGPFHMPIDAYLTRLTELLGAEKLETPVELFERQHYHQLLASQNQEKMNDAFSFHLQSMLASQYRFMYKPSNPALRISAACSLDEAYANAKASYRMKLINHAELTTLQSLAQQMFLVQNQQLGEACSLYVLLQPSIPSYEASVVQLLDGDQPKVQQYYRQSLQCLNEFYDSDLMCKRYYSMVVPLEQFQKPDRLQAYLLGYSILRHVNRLHRHQNWALPMELRFMTLSSHVEQLERTIRLPNSSSSQQSLHRASSQLSRLSMLSSNSSNVIDQQYQWSSVTGTEEPVIDRRVLLSSPVLPPVYQQHQQAQDRYHARLVQSTSALCDSLSEGSSGGTLSATMTPSSSATDNAEHINNRHLQLMRTTSLNTLQTNAEKKQRLSAKGKSARQIQPVHRFQQSN